MRKILVISCMVLSLVFLSACFQNSYPSQPIITDDDLGEKDIALAFSLNIVESYFEKDCDFFYDSLTDPLHTFDGDAHDLSELPEEEACDSVKETVSGDHQFEDYLDAYNYEILDKDEYEAKYPEAGDLQYTPGVENYLFVGSEQKGDERFMWDDMLVFTVANTDNGWKITGVSG